jgi:hypothetical protein
MRFSLPCLAFSALLRRKAAPAQPLPSAAQELPSPLWEELNAVLKPFVLVEGFSTQEPPEVAAYIEMAQDESVHTICETGFNAGHSTLVWLLANPTAHVYSFDLGQYAYTTAAAAFLKQKFPDRFTLTVGDSTQTLPKFVLDHPDVRCDLAVVDGGHMYEVASADLLNMQALSSAVARVVVDDTPCAVSWCLGPALAWAGMIKQNRVVETRNQPMGPYRGFVVGHFVNPMSLPDQEAAETPVPILNSKAVVQVLLSLAPATKDDPGYVINFGAGDGIAGMPGTAPDPRLVDPTFPLFSDLALPGVAVEGNPQYLPALEKNLPWQRVSKKIAMIKPGNVGALLTGAPQRPLYMKNDIDGYDCAVDWAVLKAGYRPRAIQLEVNPEIPWPVAFGVGYSEEFTPKLGAAGFYGCSLKLTTSLLHGFGYDLVGVGDTHDAFFLRRDVREAAKLHVADGAAASAALLKCCSPHQFGIGAAEGWAEAARITPPATLIEELRPAMEAACKASQGTSTCRVPYALSLDAADYLAL